ncbi:MBL fold metallo-hydrolase [Anaerovorax odorimutans]|uniref:MBL fold metallo-hydrolase n=1 Tax=Anaerovorax odorimutans TaxID=109327 RepID=UPI00041607B4|nr:MBL fold metallo-hydrolase [Anaerovorax odorimutans]
MILKNFMSGPLSVNCYIVADEETKKGFMVDPGGYNQLMVNFIKENQIELEYIILTHGHGDHIGGVTAYLDEHPHCKLVACKHEAELLRNPNMNFSAETCGVPITLNPNILVDDGDKLSVGKMELTFYHTPGHTKGGMCILVDNYLFSGDTLFAQSIGRTDLYGGSYKEIKDSIRNKLFVLPDDTQVYPGHMEPTTIGFEKRNNPFV